MDRLRDRFWLLGIPPNSHEGWFGIKKRSRITAAESAYYLGIRNIAIACCRGKPEHEMYAQECMAMDTMREVVWGITGAGGCNPGFCEAHEKWGHLEPILEVASKFGNVTGAIFDDFFSDNSEPINRPLRFTPDVLREIRGRLHNHPARKLDMWCVLYAHEMDMDEAGTLPLKIPLAEQVSLFDGVTFWTWLGKDLKKFDENIQRARKMTEGKRLLLGCYLYNYGQECELTAAEMEFQLTTYSKYIRDGSAEGVIFCTNSCVDLGFEAVEFAKSWMREHGDEPAVM